MSPSPKGRRNSFTGRVSRAAVPTTGSLVLERLLVAAGEQSGDLHPPCHRTAVWIVRFARGGHLHLHCAECFEHALTVELR